MKGKGQPPPDLLVCFPARGHLNLMPKPICSPARPRHRRRHSYHFQRNSSVRNSPVLWGKAKNENQSSDISEPTSPKVTCAGQIKVRPRRRRTACENWQAVMEEIERLQNKNDKQGRRRSSWRDLIAFKKDLMQFLTFLRNIRLDLRCLGRFPAAEVTSEDETEEKQSDHEQEETGEVFSNWFMIVEEEKGKGDEKITRNNEIRQRKTLESCFSDKNGEESESPAGPPANALLLMRCRSAPARSWVEEEEEKQECGIEKEKINDEKEEKIVVDLSRFSEDAADETLVVGGGIRDLILRSRSWKR